MKPIIRTRYSGVYYKGESYSTLSITVPGQSMSVPEILKRIEQGLSIGGAKVPLYLGDQVAPNVAGMDIVDRMAVLDAARERVAELQAQVNQLEKERREAIAKAEDDYRQQQLKDLADEFAKRQSAQ